MLRYLKAEQIDLYAQDLGGSHARRVCFMPESGKVVVRKLAEQDVDDPSRRATVATGSRARKANSFASLSSGAEQVRLA